MFNHVAGLVFQGLGRLLAMAARGQKVVRRINALIADALRHPTEGIGKPECLKHQLSGAWSRRITQEHRLVYLFDQEKLVIVSCRLHYET